MPRPKGSKNKVQILSIDERIIKATKELENLQEQVKSKKAELKGLEAEKAEAEKAKVFEAIASSGKSVEEIIALINSAE